MNLADTVSAYLKNEEIRNEVPSEDLLSVSVSQGLQTILYPVFKSPLYKKYYLSWAVRCEHLEKLKEEITTLFNANEIPHVYFKGAVLAHLYPDPAVRTRGDIDLYTDISHIERAKSLLMDSGFAYDEENMDSMHHLCFNKAGMEVELHFRMIDADNLKSWLDFMEEPFTLCNKKEGFLYEFRPTEHFLYCMMHFAHHLRHGAGIRYIMDFYYMLSETKIRLEYLHEMLPKLSLEVLYSNIINEIRHLCGRDFDDTIDLKDVSFFEEYLLSYGIHGFQDNDTSFHASAHKDRGRYFISRVFMTDKAYRTSLYPRAGTKWYLYVFILIHHLGFLLFHKTGSFIRFLFGRNNNKKLYDKLGI